MWEGGLGIHAYARCRFLGASLVHRGSCALHFLRRWSLYLLPRRLREVLVEEPTNHPLDVLRSKDFFWDRAQLLTERLSDQVDPRQRWRRCRGRYRGRLLLGQLFLSELPLHRGWELHRLICSIRDDVRRVNVYLQTHEDPLTCNMGDLSQFINPLGEGDKILDHVNCETYQALLRLFLEVSRNGLLPHPI